MSAAKSASKAAGKRAAPPPPPPADSSEEEAENEYQDMQRLFKSARSWESHIEKIDTIERTVEGGLMVYFTLYVVRVFGSVCGALADAILLQKKRHGLWQGE